MLVVVCLARPTVAQTPRPLEKVELIRLLTNPLFSQSEVADVVRRSCVGFRPTDRDWTDLRNAGAGGEVIATVAACASPRQVSTAGVVATTAAPPLTAVPVTAEVVSSAGSPATVRVMVHRGGRPQRRVPLMLRGTSALGLSRDATAITDDSGLALFQLPPQRQVGTHRLEIVGRSGASFLGRPSVGLTIRAGEPARLRVTPQVIASSERPVTIVVTVTDSLDNAVSGQPVELASPLGSPVTVPTDSLGRAAFALLAAALPRGGSLRIRVGPLPPLDLRVADAAGLSPAATGFTAPTLRGRVGAPLGEPVMFRARTIEGAAATGQVVRFRGVNARVTPDSAVLDSTGRVAVDVVFGARAGDAMIVARIDSVEKLLTIPIDPGPVVALVLQYGNRVVTGRRIVVPVDTPFVVRLTARDFYGNEASVATLGQMLRSAFTKVTARTGTDLEVVNLEFNDATMLITLKAPRPGIYDFAIGSGITASLRVEAIRGL